MGFGSPSCGNTLPLQLRSPLFLPPRRPQFGFSRGVRWDFVSGRVGGLCGRAGVLLSAGRSVARRC
eukprot:9027579-Pyramimonas_sp.AAC.1